MELLDRSPAPPASFSNSLFRRPHLHRGTHTVVAVDPDLLLNPERGGEEVVASGGEMARGDGEGRREGMGAQAVGEVAGGGSVSGCGEVNGESWR